MIIECCGVKIRTLRCPYCGKEHKKEKEKPLGQKIIEFDNSLGTVADFNRIFDEVQGGNQNDEIDILDPYTHYGRDMVRYYTDGTKREFRFLFDDEEKSVQGGDSSLVLDTYDKKSGRFLFTYRSMTALARDVGYEIGSVNHMLRNDDFRSLPITIKKRRLC
jgi:hypothetical protein